MYIDFKPPWLIRPLEVWARSDLPATKQIFFGGKGGAPPWVPPSSTFIFCFLPSSSTFIFSHLYFLFWFQPPGCPEYSMLSFMGGFHGRTMGKETHILLVGGEGEGWLFCFLLHIFVISKPFSQHSLGCAHGEGKTLSDGSINCNALDCRWWWICLECFHEIKYNASCW